MYLQVKSKSGLVSSKSWRPAAINWSRGLSDCFAVGELTSWQTNSQTGHSLRLIKALHLLSHSQRRSRDGCQLDCRRQQSGCNCGWQSVCEWSTQNASTAVDAAIGACGRVGWGTEVTTGRSRSRSSSDRISAASERIKINSEIATVSARFTPQTVAWTALAAPVLASACQGQLTTFPQVSTMTRCCFSFPYSFRVCVFFCLFLSFLCPVLGAGGWLRGTWIKLVLDLEENWSIWL